MLTYLSGKIRFARARLYDVMLIEYCFYDQRKIAIILFYRYRLVRVWVVNKYFM